MNHCPVKDSCQSYDEHCLGCCGSLALEFAVDSHAPLLYKKRLFDDPDHPVVARRQELRAEAKRVEKERKRRPKYQEKSRLVKRAFKNEASTRKDIIRATARSGAANGDGDSRLGDGQWGIDDKLYTTATSQFTVRVADVDKASRQKSVIVVTLSTGRKFVVAELEDFCSCAAALAELGK